MTIFRLLFLFFFFFFFGGKKVTVDTLFEIVVAAPGKMVVRVTITLPEQFPYQPPVIQCLPPIPSVHLDANGYLKPSAHEGTSESRSLFVVSQGKKKTGLQRWNVQNNLGKVVYEVIAGVIAPATPAAGAGETRKRVLP